MLSRIEGIGSVRILQLIEYLGTPENAVGASLDTLSAVPGFSDVLARAVREKSDPAEARKIVEEIARKQWRFSLYCDPDYPESLKNIPDRPAFFFHMGEFIPDDSTAVAIVGSRMASESGMVFAESLARALAEHNITVVSGMARGIDTAAHEGTLASGGRTLAVWGSSLDIIYPPESRSLAERIMKSGALISEFVPGTSPEGYNFPRRNRIISGLSQAVVVIEAAERSGALSTAAHALAQNREVFAVPGSPRSATSRGTNRLIKEGARLLTSIDDIFSEMPRLANRGKAVKAQKQIDLTISEKGLLSHFQEGPIHIDTLSRQAATPVTELMPLLLALELKGVIKEISGKRFILN